MKPVSLGFPVPRALGADRTPEDRGCPRDEVRLLVSRPEGDTHHRFLDLPTLLRPGDLLVVNESATVPASLEARGAFGRFRVSLSTAYGRGLWLIEPRKGFSEPGPLPLAPGDPLEIGGVAGRYVADFPGIPRLGFFHAEGDLAASMRERGRPIRYGYLSREYPIEAYQTLFARVPGSAEMPSAGRPFTPRLREGLRRAGIDVAPILLHTGVSSLEARDIAPLTVPVYPEPFEVPTRTVEAVRRARERGARVVGVGTTVVRALESATDAGELRPARGFTRLYVGPERPVRALDGLLTGFHEAESTHLALLAAFAGLPRLRRAYRTAIDSGYLWHEFGDSHLLWRDGADGRSGGGGGTTSGRGGASA